MINIVEEQHLFSVEDTLHRFQLLNEFKAQINNSEIEEEVSFLCAIFTGLSANQIPTSKI